MSFYQKYRAKNFNEMIGQKQIIPIILEAIKSDRLVHAYLLTGPRGIGKTSTARLLAKAINCEKIIADKKSGKKISGEPCNECDACREIAEGRSIDVVEIDAASHTSVDDVRDLIEKARLAPTHLAKKVYIIDEVHMLSKSAFNALLKTLEEPPAHAVFIMATTEIHKIPATIISRTQRFDFKRASKEEIIENLQRVAKAEKIDIDEAALELVAVSATGGHRDALSLLEKMAGVGEKIDIRVAEDILGLAGEKEVWEFLGAIFNDSAEEGLKIARTIFENGHDMAELNKKVIEFLRKIMLFQVSEKSLSDETAENMEKIAELSKKNNLDKTMSFLNAFIESGNLLKDVNYPLLPIEMAVVKVGSRELAVRGQESAVESRESGVGSKDSGLRVQKPETNENPESQTPNPESLAMVPVPVLQMTKDIWLQIVDETKKSNTTLAALLRDARPAEVNKDTLKLEVKFKFHKDRISEAKNCQMLEKIVRSVTGVDYKVVCTIAGLSPNSTANTKPIGENIEKAIEEVFGE